MVIKLKAPIDGEYRLSAGLVNSACSRGLTALPCFLTQNSQDSPFQHASASGTLLLLQGIIALKSIARTTVRCLHPFSIKSDH